MQVEPDTVYMQRVIGEKGIYANHVLQWCLILSVSRVAIKRIWPRLAVSLAAVGLLASIGLACYGFIIRAQAELLLKDVAALRVGESTEADASHFFEKHRKFSSNRTCQLDYCVTAFKVTNRWLEALGLEPYAEFYVGYTVKNGTVSAIHASLSRSMPIYPTFGASAGMVDEYAEYPPYLVWAAGALLVSYSNWQAVLVGKSRLACDTDSARTRICVFVSLFC